MRQKRFPDHCVFSEKGKKIVFKRLFDSGVPATHPTTHPLRCLPLPWVYIFLFFLLTYFLLPPPPPDTKTIQAIMRCNTGDDYHGYKYDYGGCGEIIFRNTQTPPQKNNSVCVCERGVGGQEWMKYERTNKRTKKGGISICWSSSSSSFCDFEGVEVE